MVFFSVFYKQKTAYEVRISDWGSDVCSADLMNARHSPLVTGRLARACGVRSAEKRGPSQSNAKPSPACPISTTPSAPRTQRIAAAGSGADGKPAENRATSLANAV